MSARHVVVDGSNIATEGRSLPSLVQLDEAVREYRKEFPEDVITVVVDATFGHRIDEAERATFDEAVAHNEIVSPPAGAIGRGDAFLLRVAEKVGATVLSNDSFQEFHGEHEWLFNNGRLIGGKPVPGVGWIFTPRTPVRGPKSREALRTAKRTARKAKPEEKKKVEKAIAVATEEAVTPDSPTVKRRRRRRGGSPPAEPVNPPLTFIEFVAAHPLGSAVEAEVDSFSSHGAFVVADGARCYIPLSGLGSPPPRAAKEVLRKGERRTFVLQALDPPRRGIELALPEFAHPSGEPTPETVEEEIKTAKKASRARKAAKKAAATDEAAVPAEAPAAVPAKKATRARKSAKKAAATDEAAAPVPALDADAGTAPEPAALPAKKATRARKSAKKAAATDEAAAPVPALDADAGTAPEPAPVPTKRATRARKSARKTPTEGGTGPEAPAEPAAQAAPPARKARRATKAPAPSDAGAEAHAEGASPRARRSSKARATGEPEPAPPARPRRGRRAAAGSNDQG